MALVSLRTMAFEFMDNSLIMMTVDNLIANQNQTRIETVSIGSNFTLADNYLIFEHLNPNLIDNFVIELSK